MVFYGFCARHKNSALFSNWLVLVVVYSTWDILWDISFANNTNGHFQWIYCFPTKHKTCVCVSAIRCFCQPEAYVVCVRWTHRPAKEKQNEKHFYGQCCEFDSWIKIQWNHIESLHKNNKHTEQLILLLFSRRQFFVRIFPCRIVNKSQTFLRITFWTFFSFRCMPQIGFNGNGIVTILRPFLPIQSNYQGKHPFHPFHFQTPFF